MRLRDVESRFKLDSLGTPLSLTGEVTVAYWAEPVNGLETLALETFRVSITRARYVGAVEHVQIESRLIGNVADIGADKLHGYAGRSWPDTDELARHQPPERRGIIKQMLDIVCATANFPL